MAILKQTTGNRTSSPTRHLVHGLPINARDGRFSAAATALKTRKFFCIGLCGFCVLTIRLTGIVEENWPLVCESRICWIRFLVWRFYFGAVQKPHDAILVHLPSYPLVRFSWRSVKKVMTKYSYSYNWGNWNSMERNIWAIRLHQNNYFYVL